MPIAQHHFVPPWPKQQRYSRTSFFVRKTASQFLVGAAGGGELQVVTGGLQTAFLRSCDTGCNDNDYDDHHNDYDDQWERRISGSSASISASSRAGSSRAGSTREQRNNGCNGKEKW